MPKQPNTPAHRAIGAYYDRSEISVRKKGLDVDPPPEHFRLSRSKLIARTEEEAA
jgi:hypothetical protein